MPLMHEDVTVADYRRHLTKMLGFIAPVEAALLQCRGLAHHLPDLRTRCKAPALESDCRALPASLPHPMPQLPPYGLAEAFGRLYVLEGATLGGQVVARHLRRRLGPEVDGALQFLTVYSQQTGARWTAFLVALEAFERRTGEGPAVVASAQACFEEFAGHYVKPTQIAQSEGGVRGFRT